MSIKALLGALSVAVLLSSAGLARAADTDIKEPGDQALSRINKNLTKHPDNRGLLNAKRRIERNQLRHEQREMARPQRPERPERAGRS